ncbi:NADH dehydrogenase [ubiquinone] 1 alpha subcomplex subunit 3 [Lepisosteus oculatus]|uniref:NADH dehydrogenase [ubiquinone] 1 alpha subcomplex subunit 3 n=1 Tax=Lepisosteus oculatus TaxID=7918 RepID=UPI0037135A6B
MAGRVAAFLKGAWSREPVVTVACGIGALAVLFPLISPYTKYAGPMNMAVPYNYPVPLRDDGNMPEVPSHPCDPQGPTLDWMKKL